MNQALLTELQGLAAFPSVTVLHTTEPGPVMRAADAARLDDLIAEADHRLRGRVEDDARRAVLDGLRRLALAATRGRSTRAVALCASPDHEALVRLGREVRTRVVVDHTFATRDMVADANRTATFRVVTVSDRSIRLLVGDRDRLVEVTDGPWPMTREDDESDEVWRRRVDRALLRERTSFSVPTVLAGVTRSVRALVDEDSLAPIGHVPGNHDRTAPAELHAAAWPSVAAWLRRDADRALARLVEARGGRIYAGGIDEVWDLANDGRVELLVVEDDYRLTARARGPHLQPVERVAGSGVGDGDDQVLGGAARDAAGDMAGDVVDDVVDELIETVLRAGGEAVVVPPGELGDHDHVAAVLRY